MASANGYYPICLALTGRPCLVVGGGRVAQQKITTLLRYGGDVTVVSPTLTPRVRRWARQGRLRYHRRTFRASDVTGKWLVYGATDDPITQQVVFRAAQRRKIFVNIVDVPTLCTFIAPAQIKRGPLTIAITTGGRSPGMAKRVRKEIQRVIGPEYAALTRLLERLRPTIRQIGRTPQERKRLVDRLVYGGLLEQLRRGNRRHTQARVKRLLKQVMGKHLP